MFQVIRDRAQGWFAWAVVLLLIIPFALWGIGEYFSGDAKTYVAKVNGIAITPNDFQNAYERQRARLQEMLGGKIDPALIDDKRFKQEVLNSLIEEEVLAQAAIEAGFRVSDVQLKTEIEQVDNFKANGKFDPELYTQFLRSQGFTAGIFEDRLRRSILVNQLRNSVIGTTVATPREIDDALSLNEQQRDISYLKLPVTMFMDNAVPNAAEIQQYYEKNKSQFKLPEQVSVDYIQFSAEAISQKISVDEAALRTMYADQAAGMVKDEQRRASHILIQVDRSANDAAVATARSKADKLLARARTGESFESLAKQNSEDSGSAVAGGDLGFFGRGVMDKAFEQAAFTLAKGQISDVIRSDFGFHIIKLADIKANRPALFEEVRGKLEQDYRRRKAEEQFFEQVELITNAAYEHPDTLSDVAKVANLPIQTSGVFTATAGVGVAAHPKVRDAAFSEDVLRGNNSEPIETGPNNIVILRVKEHKPAAAQPLEAVRELIVARLHTEKARDKAKAASEALLAALKKGTDAAALAKENRAEWKRVGYVKRDNQSVDAPAISAAFKIPKPAANNPAYWAGDAGGEYTVVILHGVREATPSNADNTVRENLKQGALRTNAENEFKAFVEELKKNTQIERKAEAEEL